MTAQTGKIMKNDKLPISDLDPILIQSWFDGELTPEDLEDITEDDIANHPMVSALAELRDVVCTDVANAFDDVDEDAMWAAISKNIANINVKTGLRYDEETPQTTQIKPLSQNQLSAPSRHAHTASTRKSTHAALRWLPAILGAALFCLSLPGLYTMFSNNDDEPAAIQSPSTTVVYVGTGAVDQNTQNALNYAAHTPEAWKNRQQDQNALLPKSRFGVTTQSPEDQLTVEEMDTAIRLLMNRLETLEYENLQRIERGDTAIKTDLDAPNIL